MKFAVEAENLTKLFSPSCATGKLFPGLVGKKDEAVGALRNVSFKVPVGEIFGLIGPNGAGKTTLLKVLSGLILPSSGNVLVGGHDVLTESIRARRQIGLVNAEERSFYWRISGRKNLEFFAVLYDLSLKEARSRVAELISLLDIKSPDRMVSTYSSGMKQRLALARALLHDPPLLFMDEPTKSLDPPSVKMFHRFVREHLCGQQKKTIVWATHNLVEAEKMCSRIGLLKEGQLLTSGSLEELRARFDLPSNSTLDDVFDVIHQEKAE